MYWCELGRNSRKRAPSTGFEGGRISLQRESRGQEMTHHVTTDSETTESDHSAEDDEVRSRARPVNRTRGSVRRTSRLGVSDSRNTKDSTEDEGSVPSRSPPNQVGRDTPEGRPDDEATVQRESGHSDVRVGAPAGLVGDGGHDDGDSLKPDICRTRGRVRGGGNGREETSPSSSETHCLRTAGV
jgi:hypothetical protein